MERAPDFEGSRDIPGLRVDFDHGPAVRVIHIEPRPIGGQDQMLGRPAGPQLARGNAMSQGELAECAVAAVAEWSGRYVGRCHALVQIDKADAAATRMGRRGQPAVRRNRHVMHGARDRDAAQDFAGSRFGKSQLADLAALGRRAAAVMGGVLIFRHAGRFGRCLGGLIGHQAAGQDHLAVRRNGEPVRGGQAIDRADRPAVGAVQDQRGVGAAQRHEDAAIAIGLRHGGQDHGGQTQRHAQFRIADWFHRFNSLV
jgi:hypothetical protein